MRVVLIAAAAAALLAACSTASTSSTAPSTVGGVPPTSAIAAPPSAAAPSSAPGVVAPPSPVDTSTLSCTDFDMAAAHLTTYYDYAALAINTDNETASIFTRINDALALMTAMAPQCAPKGVAALTAFAPAAAAFQAGYRPGRDPANVTASKAALKTVIAEGAKVWTALGKNPADWDDLSPS